MKFTGAMLTRRSFLQSLSRATAAAYILRPIAGHGLGSAYPPSADERTAPGFAEGAIEFESSDLKLAAGFRWAKAQALAYVRNGDPVGPWYEAALPGRDAFCMRDVSHMSTGAQLLGLGARTRNMLRQFAAHVSASKRWCSWWEITGQGKPAPIDYKNDADFWYDLPANFDVLDACSRQYRWSQDAAYIGDPVFLNFYRHTVTDYVAAWNHNHDGLLEHLPGDGHRGIGTYDEDLQQQALVGADLVAAQYAAYRDYASLERARGRSADAAEFAAKAASLKALYNNRWWDPATHSFYGALGEDGRFHANLGATTGGSDIEFPLYFGVVDPGPKTQASLDRLEGRLHLERAMSAGMVGGVEGISYYPDIFYAYGRAHVAYRVLLALMDPHLKRRTYPEVSFTVIGNLGAGLMGICPASRAASVRTHPQLTEETAWAALRHAPVGRNAISVRHAGVVETSFSNESGPPIFWEASFPGSVRTLLVDGRKVPAQAASGGAGMERSYCKIQVPPGATRVARTEPE